MNSQITEKKNSISTKQEQKEPIIIKPDRIKLIKQSKVNQAEKKKSTMSATDAGNQIKPLIVDGAKKQPQSENGNGIETLQNDIADENSSQNTGSIDTVESESEGESSDEDIVKQKLNSEQKVQNNGTKLLQNEL